MDTGTHIVCNLWIQSRPSKTRMFLLIMIAAAIPDLPIVAFYAWESLVLGTPESVIWSQHYFLPVWQDFFDIFNSIPLVLALFLVSLFFRWQWLSIVMIGMALHILLDFPFNHDDAHRHFYPFSDWKFLSPISYWDPQFYGDEMRLIQIFVVVVGLIVLWFRHPGRPEKIIVSLLAVVYVIFQVFATLAWGA